MRLSQTKVYLHRVMNPNIKRYIVAEFFSGCGGFSHGFWRTGRFQVVFGNDIKEFALKTFERNHTHDGRRPLTLKKDIRLVSDNELVQMFEKEGIGEIDCILGGPPCQGFSQMRRSEARRDSKIVRFGGYNKLDNDPRNDLVLRFLEAVAVLNPKVVVIENVPQFLSHYHDGKKGGIAQQVEYVFNELGYEMVCNVLNAADYGIPQLRQRAVMIASRIGKIALPIPSHADVTSLNGHGRKEWVTVADAISDLPPNPPLHEASDSIPRNYLDIPLSGYARSMRTSEEFPFNHITRHYQDRIIKIIEHMREGETWDESSARMQKRFDAILSKSISNGETRRRALKRLESEGEIISAFYKRYYWSAYTRLAWNRPALTITANANFLGSGRFTHPNANRGITMREAARLQSFDDAFTFYTSDKNGKETENIGVGLDMIGEAVPPLLAKSIAMAVVSHLDNNKGSRNEFSN